MCAEEGAFKGRVSGEAGVAPYILSYKVGVS